MHSNIYKKQPKIKKFCPNSDSGSKSGTGTGFILPKMRLICFSVSSGLILTPGLFFSADLCLTRVVFVLVISSVSLLALRWLFMYMLYFLCCFVLIMVLLWLIIYLSRLFRWLLVLSKKFLESIEIYFLFFAVMWSRGVGKRLFRCVQSRRKSDYYNFNDILSSGT